MSVVNYLSIGSCISAAANLQPEYGRLFRGVQMLTCASGLYSLFKDSLNLGANKESISYKTDEFYKKHLFEPDPNIITEQEEAVFKSRRESSGMTKLYAEKNVQQEIGKVLKNCTAQYFPQLHWREWIEDQFLNGTQKEQEEALVYIEKIWESQCKIANSLRLRAPDLIVILEKLPSDMSLTELIGDDKIAKIKKAFPHGVPECGDSWQFTQKYILARNGAVSVLFSLGQLSDVRGMGITLEKMHEINRLYQPLEILADDLGDPSLKELGFRLLHIYREDRAVEQIQMCQAAARDVKVALVFGIAHDFLARYQACGLKLAPEFED